MVSNIAGVLLATRGIGCILATDAPTIRRIEMIPDGSYSTFMRIFRRAVAARRSGYLTQGLAVKFTGNVCDVACDNYKEGHNVDC